MLREADVVVIGGGVHGASAAYHLARAGKSVALLEKRTIGSGSSGASGGIIRSHYSTKSMIGLAHRAATRWPGLAEELGHPVDYVRNGLVVAVDADDAPVMEQVVKIQRQIGVDTGTVAPQEISRWIPDFNTDGLALAAYEGQAGYADPYSSAVAFAKRAQELGAEVYQETVVLAIEDSGATRQVITDRGVIRTPLVVNCAGAWAASVARMVGVDLPVQPGLLRMTAFDPRDTRWQRGSPTWLDLTTMTYCRPDAAGYMLAGGGRAENAVIDTEVIDPDAYPSRPPLEFEAEIGENLTRRCPCANLTRVRSWAGPDGNSPDFHLIVGPVPGVRGYFQVVGGSGNSFKLSPATGEAVAEYVTMGTCTYLDLHAFSITRFAEGRPFRGRYKMHIIG